MNKLRVVAVVYAQAIPASTFSGSGPTDTLLITAIVSLAVAMTILIFSVLSFVGLCLLKIRSKKVLLLVSTLLQIFLLLVLLTLAIFILAIGETELQRLAYSTQITVFYYYNTTSLVEKGWDFVQYYFKCCGIKWNSTDWLRTPSTGWVYSSTLPRSCCGSDSNDIGYAGRVFLANDVPTLTGNCYYSDIRKPTCYDTIKTNLLTSVSVFLFGLTLIVLVLVILSTILVCQ